MTLFYLSRQLLIDERRYATPGGSYRLDDLSNIHVHRGRRDQLSHTGTYAVTGTLILAATVGPLVDSPAGYALAALTILVALGTSGISLIRRRPRWELRASHRGSSVCLLSTTDEQTFGQVRRGLLRAYEASQRV
jgi:hypothetical protein